MHWKELLLVSIGLLTVRSSSGVYPSEQVVLDLPQFKVPSKLPVKITNYLRSIDVAGTITREQSVIHLKRDPGDQVDHWYFPIQPHRASNMSSMEIHEGDSKKAKSSDRRGLQTTPLGFDPEKQVHVIQVEWPVPKADQAIVTIDSHFLDQTTPKPTHLTQEEGPKQGLYWEDDLLAGFCSLPGVFTDDAEVKIKIKTPTPRVFQKQAPPGFDVQQASGSQIVIFTNKISAPKLSDEPQKAYLHYFQPFPLMVIGNLTRLVEVSHWGNNVAIEDKFELENRGPELKGPFSRIVHHNSLFGRIPGATAHILTGLTLELPQGAKNPYYVDMIGNVSTSRFRPSMPSTIGLPQPKFRKLKEAKTSKLELSPRYPIAGGWNYSFTVGFNLEAGKLLKQLEPAHYILKVPFFTNALDVPIDSATLRVRLPEGAFKIDVVTPFPVTELYDNLIDKTYLDTSGRPTVLIRKKRCTEKHAADIYITYTRGPVMSLQKPLAIAGWLMSLFVLAAVTRRFKWNIGHS